MRDGEVWWADLPAPAGRRPVVLLSCDEAYAVRELVIVAPVTSRARRIATEVALGCEDGLPRPYVEPRHDRDGSKSRADASTGDAHGREARGRRERAALRGGTGVGATRATALELGRRSTERAVRARTRDLPWTPQCPITTAIAVDELAAVTERLASGGSIARVSGLCVRAYLMKALSGRRSDAKAA
jgi:mRNA-degrading endonuclease toxin of MazEF toxin-antitoxin module